MFTGSDGAPWGSANAVTGLGDPQLDSALTAEYEGIHESPQEDKLQAVADTTTKLAAKLKSLAAEAKVAIAEAEKEVATTKTNWDASVKDQREGHSEVLRKLHEEGLTPTNFCRLRRPLMP